MFLLEWCQCLIPIPDKIVICCSVVSLLFDTLNRLHSIAVLHTIKLVFYCIENFYFRNIYQKHRNEFSFENYLQILEVKSTRSKCLLWCRSTGIMFTSNRWRSEHRNAKFATTEKTRKKSLSSNVHQNVSILRVIIVNAQQNVCSRVKIEINWCKHCPTRISTKHEHRPGRACTQQTFTLIQVPADLCRWYTTHDKRSVDARQRERNERLKKLWLCGSNSKYDRRDENLNWITSPEPIFGVSTRALEIFMRCCCLSCVCVHLVAIDG